MGQTLHVAPINSHSSVQKWRTVPLSCTTRGSCHKWREMRVHKSRIGEDCKTGYLHLPPPKVARLSDCFCTRAYRRKTYTTVRFSLHSHLPQKNYTIHFPSSVPMFFLKITRRYRNKKKPPARTVFFFVHALHFPQVWDLVALECVNDLDRHSVALVALVATADNCVWSAAVDGTVLLWNGRTQQMVRQIAAMSTGIALLRPVVAATVWTFWSCLDSGLVMAYSHEALGGAAEGPVARLDAAHAQQLQEVIHKQQQQLRDMEAAYDEARVRLLVHESRGPQTAAAASPQQQKRSLDQVPLSLLRSCLRVRLRLLSSLWSRLWL